MIIEDLNKELDEYELVKISENNINDVYEMMKSNAYYYSKVQFHELKMEECLEDVYTLPPHTAMDQKFYYALYQNQSLIGVIDYIEKFPEEKTVFIGLFMLHQCYHGHGISNKMISCFKKICRMNGFNKIKLACYESNKIGYRFWQKQGFKKIETVVREVEGHSLKLFKLEYTF